jgi:steroid delta-isomerase-like uncharacterized protein
MIASEVVPARSTPLVDDAAPAAKEVCQMPEDNKAIVHRFEQAFAANDVATIDQLCDPNLVDHNPIPEQKPGLSGFKETIAFYKTVFPDSRVEIHNIFGEGDLVATHWTVVGTHQAEFFGVPATGRQVRAEGMNIYRLAGGRITDVWTQFDGLGVMQQLGALPT